MKELSEEQEELRGELEQELREEVDLSHNKTREVSYLCQSIEGTVTPLYSRCLWDRPECPD